MPELEDVIEALCLHATDEDDPWTVDRVFADIKDAGELAVDALIWALQQPDVNVKLLALQLLQEFYTGAKKACPVVRVCILDENRLVRLTAINTARILDDCSPELVPLLNPLLTSTDDVEKVLAAGILWRCFNSDAAHTLLSQASAEGEDSSTGLMARYCLENNA
jgi:hypothetical protein